MIQFRLRGKSIDFVVIATMPSGDDWEWKVPLELQDGAYAMLLHRELKQSLIKMDRRAYEQGYRDGRARRKKSKFWMTGEF